MDTTEFIGKFRLFNGILPDGTVLFEDEKTCSFVLTRGVHKGQCCGKRGVFAPFGRQRVPACESHLGKFLFGTPIYKLTYFLESRFSSFDESPLVIEQVEVSSLTGVDASHIEAPQQESGVLRKIDISSIPKAIERSNECTVCFDNTSLLVLPCGHTICKGCCERIQTQTCPMCRFSFEIVQIRKW